MLSENITFFCIFDVCLIFINLLNRVGLFDSPCITIHCQILYLQCCLPSLSQSASRTWFEGVLFAFFLCLGDQGAIIRHRHGQADIEYDDLTILTASKGYS